MVEPVEDQDFDAQSEYDDSPSFVQDANADVKTVLVNTAEPEDGLMSTLLFWFAIIAIIFLIGRYSDTLCRSARRLIYGTSAEDEEIQAQKLSGGDDNSEVSGTLGDKLRDFAHASSETIRKTLSKGRDTFQAATESIDARQRRGHPQQDNE